MDYDFSSNLKLGLGLDIRGADIYHIKTIRDLLGGDYFVNTDSEFDAPGTQKVLGDPIDFGGEVKSKEKLPILREAPSFEEQSTSTEMFVTGIKVVDLLAPYAKGGKIGLFGGAGVGKTVTIMELINNIAKALSIKGFNNSVKYGKNKDSDFLILTPDKFLYENKEYIINSQILGDHFRSNMVGAIVLAMKNGISIKESLDAIFSFPGVKRRTELIGIAKGISIYDDYGHHPTEMNATISSLKKITKNKLYVVFQPHRYSRTKEYFNLFKDSLVQSDFSIVTDIYPAGEDPIPGISSKNFEGENIKYLQSTRFVPEYLSQEVSKGDVILTLGAGDITLLGPKILKYINENK